MASLLQKLLRRQSTARIITTFNKHQSSNLTPQLLTHFDHQSHDPNSIIFSPSSLGRFKPENLNPSHSLQFYPSFSFGFFLNPISSAGFVQSEADDADDADDVDSGDSPTIWADSVKKKRKKKMNKHKLKKLRKRLRH